MVIKVGLTIIGHKLFSKFLFFKGHQCYLGDPFLPGSGLYIAQLSSNYVYGNFGKVKDRLG